VENCADAIVTAVERREAACGVFNVVDDGSPTQRRYMRELRELAQPRPRIVALPWTLLRVSARLAWTANRLWFRGEARLPGLLVPASLHNVAKPLRYSNASLKTALHWRPRFDRSSALARVTDPALQLPTLLRRLPTRARVFAALGGLGLEQVAGLLELLPLLAF
jgi:nucleoside-diphosphate-sugar epimerase